VTVPSAPPSTLTPAVPRRRGSRTRKTSGTGLADQLGGAPPATRGRLLRQTQTVATASGTWSHFVDHLTSQHSIRAASRPGPGYQSTPTTRYEATGARQIQAASIRIYLHHRTAIPQFSGSAHSGRKRTRGQFGNAERPYPASRSGQRCLSWDCRTRRIRSSEVPGC
jgi:hypothetical protein